MDFRSLWAMPGFPGRGSARSGRVHKVREVLHHDFGSPSPAQEEPQTSLAEGILDFCQCRATCSEKRFAGESSSSSVSLIGVTSFLVLKDLQSRGGDSDSDKEKSFD